MSELNKTKSEAAILVVAVFLLGILVGGVGNHLWDVRVQGEHRTQGGLRPKEVVISEFTRELQLTSEQQTQLGGIIDDTRAKWHALYAPLDAQHEQIRQEGRSRIRAILTPEQLPKFDAFMQRIDEQRKKEQPAH
jgi:Spy/CpxP family protein refolding chaperone